MVENNKYVMFAVNQIPNFFTLVGRNTNYIIHPEEILADNFVLMINNKTAANPEIIEKISEKLKK